MALELRQSLKLSQQLVMTPQLQQAIKLLQLSRLELQQAIREELEINPVLEESQEGVTDGEDAAGREDEPPEAAAASESAEPAKEDQSLRGEGGLIDRVDWNYYFGDGSPSEGRGEREREEDDGRPYYENLLTRKPTLAEHLEWQMGLSRADGKLRHLAAYLIGNIDENGYLMISAEEAAEALSEPVENVENAIAAVQALDPKGVGARDLRECLMIQARERGEEFSLPLKILTDHFDLFSRGDLAGISRRMRITREAVREAYQKLVSLSPKPGREFSGDDIHYITPDVYVFKVDGQWVINLNEDGQPRLRLSAYYRRLLSEGEALRKEDREFLKQKVNSALWFIKSIQQRQRTIYKVVESIIKLQGEFLDHGPKYLKPLTLRDVAEDISMHESTVSRVTSGKYVYTPHGIFELKYFFNSGLNRDGGAEDIASKSVKEKIREIISAEGEGKPLSDQELMRLLRNQGIRIARRTVTKYRAQLGMLPSSKRKKPF
ncbi:MAG: RNA polymerase factor sigma-54 [Deltaproteobacteria bacterium]|nr:RNA polymerase factor sigma-54 [Deltaproteobacteria bacterium]PWB62172.1 MAG: RNA polymerase sigma-54 factor [Deltaproteobacteria bacterium]